MACSLPDRFVPVFLIGDDEYIFIQILGEGIQGQAQLVLHVQSGEYRVRKVFKHKHTFVEIDDSAEKNEGRILEFLQTEASKSQMSPNIVTIHGSSNVVLATENTQDRMYMAVIYLFYCNGGELRRFIQADVPASILLRAVAQVAHALRFMYNNRVLHRDLHSGNIFAHFTSGSIIPDFYVGDFGAATSPRPARPTYFASDINRLLSTAQPLRLKTTTTGVVDELLRLVRNCEDSSGFPDLSRLLLIVDRAIAEEPVTEADLARIPGPCLPGITYYDSIGTCVSLGILGPHDIARVSLDSAGGFQSIELVSNPY
ncbi:unnamed protein product [Discula destructiva]